MNEKYVTSLSISKQMKEAGITSDTIFSWMRWDEDHDWRIVWTDNYDHRTVPATFEMIPAYLAGELGEMLPTYIDDYPPIEYRRDNHFNLILWKRDKVEFQAIDNNEADARAKMLLHLKKEGLIGKEDK